MGAVMSSDEIFDRLHNAIRVLTRDAPIKERLLQAWSLYLSELDLELLPAEMRAPYADTQRAFQSTRPLRGETMVLASVRKMSCAEAARHAAFITDLFAMLVRRRVADLAPRRAAARAAANPQAVVSSPVVELLAAEG